MKLRFNKGLISFSGDRPRASYHLASIMLIIIMIISYIFAIVLPILYIAVAICLVMMISIWYQRSRDIGYTRAFFIMQFIIGLVIGEIVLLAVEQFYSDSILSFFWLAIKVILLISYLFYSLSICFTPSFYGQPEPRWFLPRLINNFGNFCFRCVVAVISVLLPLRLVVRNPDEYLMKFADGSRQANQAGNESLAAPVTTAAVATAAVTDHDNFNQSEHSAEVQTVPAGQTVEAAPEDTPNMPQELPEQESYSQDNQLPPAESLPAESTAYEQQVHQAEADPLDSEHITASDQLNNNFNSNQDSSDTSQDDDNFSLNK